MARIMIAFPAHMAAALDDYRWERERQVREIEKSTGGYDTDEQMYRDMGGKPAITLKDWLKARGAGPGEQKAMEAPMDPDFHYTPDADAWGLNDPPSAW